MIRTGKYAVTSFFLCLAITLLLPIRPASADNVFDRIKSIYNTPEKLEDLQQQYADHLAKLEQDMAAQRRQMEQEMAAQQQQLEEARRQADELLLRQELLQERHAAAAAENEALAAQNAQLAERLAQAERDRQTLIRRIIISVGTLAAITLAYALSIRLWRYAAWRRHAREHHGAVNG